MSVEWLRPPTLVDALEELGDEDTLLFAGGVSLVVLMNVGFLEPGRLVSLANVAELRGVAQREEVLDLGAMCTHAELEDEPMLQATYPAACTMFAGVGNVRVRSWGTLGGNLAHADPAQDPPVMLTALDASIEVVGRNTHRTVAVHDIAEGPLSPALEPDEIVTRICIPLLKGRFGTSYIKFLPGTADDYATVSVGARLEFDEAGGVVGARLAAGSVGPTVVRLERAGELLVGREIDPEVLQAVREAARDEVSPQPDRRGSADYKREMAGIVAERAVRASVVDHVRREGRS